MTALSRAQVEAYALERVACPHCHAGPRDRCRSERRVTLEHAHVQRWLRAKELILEAQEAKQRAAGATP
jgi:hypothetical protein